MNSWAKNRKRMIFGLVFLFLILVIGLPLFLLIYQKPTCSDGKQNGDETGVDCGGSCSRLCAVESLPLVVKGDPRILKVATSTYEVVALINNLNSNAEVSRARYKFKLFDGQSLAPVKTIEGSEFIAPGETLIFEGPFESETPLVRATFEWEDSSIVFKKSVFRGKVEVKNLIFKDSRVEASIKNTSLENVSKIDLSAIIFDKNGNIFAASKTFIDKLKPGEETRAIFTWPAPLNSQPAEIRVISRILP